MGLRECEVEFATHVYVFGCEVLSVPMQPVSVCVTVHSLVSACPWSSPCLSVLCAQSTVCLTSVCVSVSVTSPSVTKGKGSGPQSHPGCGWVDDICDHVCVHVTMYNYECMNVDTWCL